MTKHVRELGEFIAELFEAMVEDGSTHVADFLAELEEDLRSVHEVPPERQQRFLRRIELQAVGLMELQRLELINASKQALAASITAGIRMALAILT